MKVIQQWSVGVHLTALRGLETSLATARFSRVARLSATRRCYSRRAPIVAILENAVTEPKASPSPPSLAVGPYSNTNSPISASATEERPNIAELDRQKGFTEHWSVESWKQFRPSSYAPDPNAPLLDQLSSVLSTTRTAIGSSGVLSSTQAAAYWTYHVGRLGFFSTQGLLSLLASTAIGQRGTSDDTPQSRLQSIFRRGLQGPVLEALAVWYQDFNNIQEGLYNMPWDMTTPGHRQYNPAYVVSKSTRYFREAIDILGRRFSSNASTDVWVKSPIFPDYYEKTFHYQTDGWLSPWSSKVYEVSTETLFVGRQDAMQRQTLVPLSHFMREQDVSNVNILEVGCGTGRFATFVKDNYPQSKYTALDLSPFYLEEARQNMLYWKRMRAPGLEVGGVSGTGVSFIQAPAEKVPEPDASYDVVFSIYLFHELPPQAREAAVKEMARLCKPGGMVIFTDSYQLGDRPANDATLGNFGDFNEPYYRTYIATDMAALFMAEGLTPDMKLMASGTKVLSFRKPA